MGKYKHSHEHPSPYVSLFIYLCNYFILATSPGLGVHTSCEPPWENGFGENGHTGPGSGLRAIWTENRGLKKNHLGRMGRSQVIAWHVPLLLQNLGNVVVGKVGEYRLLKGRAS